MFYRFNGLSLCVYIFWYSWIINWCCLHLKKESLSCTRWFGIFHYHWWTTAAFFSSYRLSLLRNFPFVKLIYPNYLNMMMFVCRCRRSPRTSHCLCGRWCTVWPAVANQSDAPSEGSAACRAYGVCWSWGHRVGFWFPQLAFSSGFRLFVGQQRIVPLLLLLFNRIITIINVLVCFKRLPWRVHWERISVCLWFANTGDHWLSLVGHPNLVFVSWASLWANTHL